MTWGVINLIEEIKARITQAKTDENLSFQAIYVGGFDHNRKENDYPAIIIQVNSVDVLAENMQHGVTDDTVLTITYIANQKANALNTLYNTSDTSGMLYDIPVIMNYLEKKTSDGSIDLTVNATVFNLPKPRISFRYLNNLIVASISYGVKTAKYQRGAR